jgi:hypothetical protein
MKKGKDKKNKVLVAVVYNSVSDNKLWCLNDSINHISSDIIVCDDSRDKECRVNNKSFFEGLGCKYISISTEKLKTIEERIVAAKNTLRDYFLKHKEYTHIFYLESDIIVSEYIISELLSHKVDNITAIRPQQGSLPGVFLYNDLFPRDSWRSRKLPNLRLTSFEELASLNTPLIEISCYGSGCNLISRKATESASYWVKPYSPATHDILYCMDLYALGFPCYCDTRLICAHYFNPLKHPDERFDYGGDWSQIDEYRKDSVQGDTLG